MFHWAVKSPNIQALKTLHKQATTAIINTAVSQHLRLPLHPLSHCLSHCLSHFSQDNEGLTPLHWAVMCDQPAHIQMLLASTAADVSMRDAEGRTALTHAVLNSSSSCIKVLEGVLN